VPHERVVSAREGTDIEKLFDALALDRVDHLVTGIRDETYPGAQLEELHSSFLLEDRLRHVRVASPHAAILGALSPIEIHVRISKDELPRCIGTTLRAGIEVVYEARAIGVER